MSKTLINHKGRLLEIVLEDSKTDKKLKRGWVKCMYSIPEAFKIVQDIGIKNIVAGRIIDYMINNSKMNEPIIMEATQKELSIYLNYPEDRINKAIKFLEDYHIKIIFRVNKTTYMINPTYIWTFTSLQTREKWIIYIEKVGYIKAYEVYKAGCILNEFNNFYNEVKGEA